MEYIVGAGLALAVAVWAACVKFDRDRAFYPTMLVVIASYYVLFAVMGGSGVPLALETLGFGLFVWAAVIGFRTSLWLIVAALIGHGLFDTVHGALVDNPGVPRWWPGFCATFDIAAGFFLAWRLRGTGSGLPVRQQPRPARTLGQRRLGWALVVMIATSTGPAMAARKEAVRVAALGDPPAACQRF